jgi:hypothetical protein
MAPWRSDAALAHLALDQRAEAKALVAEEVEGHLTHVYQKLDITSREQLTNALATRDVDVLAPPLHPADRHRPSRHRSARTSRYPPRIEQAVRPAFLPRRVFAVPAQDAR